MALAASTVRTVESGSTAWAGVRRAHHTGDRGRDRSLARHDHARARRRNADIAVANQLATQSYNDAVAASNAGSCNAASPPNTQPKIS